MHDGHRERLKRRFLNEGLDGFEPHQILEMLLFYAIPRRDTNEIAHALLERYGSLSGVFDADPNDIATVSGMGLHSALLLSFVPQVSRFYFKDNRSRTIF